MADDDAPEILWTPPPNSHESSRIGRFLSKAGHERGIDLSDYESAWAWSVEDLDGFWASVWQDFEIKASVQPLEVLSSRSMPGARWFAGSRLNYAEHALRSSEPDKLAIVARSQSRPRATISATDLRDQVARARAGLINLGIRPGDRVAAYMPNIPETVVLMLVCSSLGAVFSSCAPEFGARAVIDRFGQIEPTVLVTVDGYRYGERVVEKSEELSAIRAELPSITTTVVLPYLRDDHPTVGTPGTVTWDEFMSRTAPLEFEQWNSITRSTSFTRPGRQAYRNP